MGEEEVHWRRSFIVGGTLVKVIYSGRRGTILIKVIYNGRGEVHW